MQVRCPPTGALYVPVQQADHPMTCIQWKRRIHDESDELEGPDADHDRDRRNPDQGEARVPDQHAEAQLEVEPGKRWNAHTVHEERSSHVERLEGGDQTGPRGTVPGQPAPVDLFQISEHFISQIAREQALAGGSGPTSGRSLCSPRGAATSSRSSLTELGE